MKPFCENDKIIGDYIQSQSTDDFSDIVSENERLEVAWYLSELSNGLLGWYPFNMESTILQVGSWFGAFAGMLSSRCKNLTVIEHDSYRAHMTKKRLKYISNVKVINNNIVDYYKEQVEKFDYIIFAIDENVDIIPDKDAYTEILKILKGALRDKGKLLLAMPNRFGVKYFCGVPDPYTKLPFDGITEHNSKLYRFDREELLQFMENIGFPYTKLYYPMPDHHYTQLIYTDELRPGSDILERLHIYSTHKTQRLLDEWILVGKLAENGVLHCFSNSFLLEAGMTPCTDVIYSALSVERGRDKAFATNIYNNDIVEKVPIYFDGEIGIRRLLDNSRELSEKGIPVLEMREKDGKVLMKRVHSPSLSVYLKDVALKDKDKFIHYVDKLQEYIYNSSEHVAAEMNCMRELSSEADWGVVLKKAYIEMIPVNCFCDDGDILFYDQEFTKDNCPANYVMFRALRDIYTFSSEINDHVPLDFMKERYGLVSTWKLYAEEEERFQTELRQRNIYTGFFYWIKHLHGTVRENRRGLLVKEEEKKTDYFNVTANLDGRRIILFGSGRMAENYLAKYGGPYLPIFLADNNADKWGKKKNGIEIKNPIEISRLMEGTYRVVVTVKNYEPIISQLEKMGVGTDSYRIYNKQVDELVDGKLKEAIVDGKYNVGYTAGVFERFDTEHLSLLKRCKTRSHYLVVGVYTDEVLTEKKAGRYGLSQEERLEMVRQCKYVDRAILIDSHNIDEIELWRELRFGCLFVDEDFEKRSDYIWLLRKLRTLGCEVEIIHRQKILK